MFRVWSLGFGNWGWGFEVWGLRLWLQNLGFETLPLKTEERGMKPASRPNGSLSGVVPLQVSVFKDFLGKWLEMA